MDAESPDYSILPYISGFHLANRKVEVALTFSNSNSKQLSISSVALTVDSSSADHETGIVVK